MSGITVYLHWERHADHPTGRPAEMFGTRVVVRAILGFDEPTWNYWNESPRPSRAKRRKSGSPVYSADLLERKAAFARLRVGPDCYDIQAAWDFRLDVLDYTDTEQVERKREADLRARRKERAARLLAEHGETENDPRSLAFVFFEESSASPDLHRSQMRRSAEAAYDGPRSVARAELAGATAPSSTPRAPAS